MESGALMSHSQLLSNKNKNHDKRQRNTHPYKRRTDRVRDGLYLPIIVIYLTWNLILILIILFGSIFSF